MAGQAAGKKKKVVVVAAIVATVVVATIVKVQVGLVGYPACLKKGPHYFFSSSRPARPSPGRASSYSDPSQIRPPSLQKYK